MTSETITAPDMTAVKSKMKAVWSAGDFGRIAEAIYDAGDEFIIRLGIERGEQVLDVACGTGNLAIPAAKAGAEVTGIDIAPNLIEQAKSRADAEGLTCHFEEGDAEAMPYADASFDTVVTMFGAMFAPRPDRTAAELIRVTRPGGRIAMANWTAEGFTGEMFKIGGRHLPPPPGIASPLQWGNEDLVRERLADGIADLNMTRTRLTFKFPMAPAEVVEHFRLYFGPTQFAFNALDENGQAALRSDLTELWTENNTATDGTTEVESEYLTVVATRA
ncbi:MAG: methyltransferase domain-containing protein [Pyrinomonadaceae bacterium]